MVKNAPAIAGGERDIGLIPGSGRPPGVGNAPRSSVLARKSPWAEESDGL